MPKVLTLVGTRPELIKMSRVIAECDKQVEHVLVHSGQNYDYELNEVFLRELGVRKPDHFLGAAGGTPMETVARVLTGIDAILESERPDALLLYGDTNTTLAVIAAKRRKIPVFHMEAGNRCFDQRVPEELNRKVVDHLSDINLVLSEHARRYLIAEGVRPETIIKTGSHLPEVLEYARPGIEASDVVARLGLEPRRYFVVSAHREETVDTPERLRSLLEALTTVRREWGFPIVFSVHPRTRARLEALGGGFDPAGIVFMPPFGYFDYIRLQRDSFCVLSDSGTITEESSILDFPAITMRDAHERPEGMDVGTLVMSGTTARGIVDAVRVVTSQRREDGRTIPLVADYEYRPVSVQVVRIVLSYIDYVRRTVWRHSGS
jgi:UDP-N-acetylglucosamine 2-epimerase (non-hydrolysing)